jgi:hypothetical protein
MIDLAGPRLVMLHALFAVDQRLRCLPEMTHRFRIARSPHLCGCDW